MREVSSEILVAVSYRRLRVMAAEIGSGERMGSALAASKKPPVANALVNETAKFQNLVSVREVGFPSVEHKWRSRHPSFSPASLWVEGICGISTAVLCFCVPCRPSNLQSLA